MEVTELFDRNVYNDHIDHIFLSNLLCPQRYMFAHWIPVSKDLCDHFLKRGKEGRENWFYSYLELDFKYAHPNYVIRYTRISLFVFIVAALFKILSLKFIFGKTNNENKLVYIFLIPRCACVSMCVCFNFLWFIQMKVSVLETWQPMWECLYTVGWRRSTMSKF